MTATAIQVENLSKLYRIGMAEQRRETLAGSIATFLRSPVQNFRQLRSLSNVTVADGDAEDVIWALRDVSFSVRKGEVLGIIGANGAGKSTLLKILAGITEPTSGHAVMRGRVASLLEVGTGFHPDLTGRENIYLNGTILGMTKAEIDRHFEEIVDFSGVERFIDTPVKRYSSGMAVRLAFAIAAHLESEVLLIDEVLAVGDRSFQEKCLGRIGALATSGRTVLFVSHNMGAITSHCPETLLVDKGRVVERGPSQTIVRQYLGLNSNVRTCGRDLTDAQRRKKVDRPLMRHVRLSSAGHLSSIVVCGGPLEVNVKLDYDPSVMSVLSLGFQIVDEMGQNIFGSNSGQYHVLVRNGRGSEWVTFGIPELPLAPGSYSITLFLGNGVADYEIIPDAISFEVVWPSSARTSFGLPQRSWGPLWVPVHWEVAEHK